MVHSAAKKPNIVVLSNRLNKYFHQLHDLLFRTHRKNKKPEIRNTDQIIIGLQEVYEFEKVRVNNVRRYYGLSTVIVKDEERITL